MPLVSVILPVHNGEKFLRDAIESILHQTFRDFEFIIINDGSTDTTRLILQSYTDSRIHIINHEQNRGIVDSLNHGIQQARGTYICRMDADDISLPARIEKQIEFLEQNSAIAVLGTNTLVINEKGIEIGREFYPHLPQEIMRALFIHNPIAHGTVMVRSTVLGECGAYDRRFLHNEDYDLWLRIGARYPLANLEDAFVKRRVHPGSITVALETELVRNRIRTLAHAIFGYYHKPHYAIFLVRPIFAYLFRLVKGMFRP